MYSGPGTQKFVEIARNRNCVQIFDEFYSHYVYDKELLFNSAAKYVDDVNQDPIVLVDGLTKNWRYPGLRLSWTVGPQDIIEKVSSAGSFLDGGAAHPIQEAAVPLLEPDLANEQAMIIQKHFAKKRSLLKSGLENLGFVIPSSCSGAFYCFASLENLPSIEDGMHLFEKLLAHKVICSWRIF